MPSDGGSWIAAMDRHDLIELHYIAPIANLASIATLGILSHNRATQVTHEDVSNTDVQDLREGKLVPDAAARNHARSMATPTSTYAGATP